MSADPWQAPDPWHVTASGYQPPVHDNAPAVVRWPSDGLIALVTTALVALSGAVVGLIWSATAPKLSIRAVVAGSESTFKSQLVADGRFLLLTIVAGIVCAAVLLILGQRGPGAVIGLAVGGLLAALIANRVGVVAQHDATLSSLRSLGLSRSAHVLDLVGFKVRALGVLVAWPLAAVIVYGLAILLHPDRR